MSTHQNPFFSGGQNSNGAGLQIPGVTMTQGALQTASHVLEFTPAQPSILHAAVSNRGNAFLQINTARIGAHDVTRIYSLSQPNQIIAVITWSGLPGPTVTIPGLLNETAIRNFLPLAQNAANTRYMTVNSEHFEWRALQGRLELHYYGSQGREALARVTRTPDTIALQIFRDAICKGLAQHCIVATAILQSGRQID